MLTNRRRVSAYAVSLFIIVVLLGTTFIFTYVAASRQLEEVSRQVDELAFREAVAAVEARIALADLVLMTMLSGREFHEFVTDDYPSDAERRLAIRRLQNRFQSFFSELPGFVALAVVDEAGTTVTTDLGVFDRETFWDPFGVDLAETAPVRGVFHPGRWLTLERFSGDWAGSVVTIARGYPRGVAPNLTLGGGMLYLDAAEVFEILDELEDRTGIVVSFDGRRPENSDRRVYWTSTPIVGERSRWTYQAFGTQSATRQWRVFRRVFIAMGVAFIAIAALVLTWLDRTTRKPFETVIKHIADRVYQVRQDSEGEDRRASLSDVEREVRSIVDQAEHLQSQVALSLPALRWQLVVERLLSPYGSGATELASATGLQLEGPRYTVVVASSADRRSDNMTAASRAVTERMVADALTAFGALETVRLMDGSVAAIISTSDDLDTDAVKAGLSAVLSFDSESVVAIGRTCEGPNAIYRSHQSARETLEYQIIAPGQRMYVFGSLSAHNAESLPGAMEKILGDLPPVLHRESAARLSGWLDDFLEAARMHASSPAMLKHAVVRLVLALRTEVGRVNRSSEFSADDLVHEVWSTTSLERVREVAESAASAAHDAVNRHKLEGGSDYRLGNDLAAFVDDNFSRQDLSLGVLAESFRISPAHASRVFRSTVGQTFQQYVSHKRIKLAEQLLVSGEDTVSDIASEVGYGEVHSLIRAFKKVYGITPAEFRRRAARRDSAALQRQP